MTPNNFDRVAFVYDGLVRLVFGKSLDNAQKHFLAEIEKGDRVLILGGGTGKILEQLNDAGEIWYIDASAKMIEKACERNVAGIVHYVVGTENDIPDEKFDVIITNFYLDLFPEDKGDLIIQTIVKTMHAESQWIVTDFNDTGFWWHRLLLKSMYWFFAFTCNIETTRLPDWIGCLEKNSLQMKELKTFYSDFVKTTIWKQ